MPRRIVAAIGRALVSEWTQPSVHFHQGALGRPVPCFEHPHCRIPHLDERDAG